MSKQVFVFALSVSILAGGTVAPDAQADCEQARSAQGAPPIQSPSGAPIPHSSSGGPVPTVQPPSRDASIIPQSHSGHAMTPQPFSGTIPSIQSFSSGPVAPFQPGSKQACISFRATERVRPT